MSNSEFVDILMDLNGDILKTRITFAEVVGYF